MYIYICIIIPYLYLDRLSLLTSDPSSIPPSTVRVGADRDAAPEAARLRSQARAAGPAEERLGSDGQNGQSLQESDGKRVFVRLRLHDGDKIYALYIYIIMYQSYVCVYIYIYVYLSIINAFMGINIDIT